MARPTRKSIGVTVAAVVMLLCGWIGIVRLNLLYPLWCFAPPDQASMIDMFESDPLYSAVPTGGELKEEKATNYQCHNGHGGSPSSPLFAKVTRLYTTPAWYSVARLHLRFDQVAHAASWVIHSERTESKHPGTGYVYVRYCKVFGDRAADAWIQSRYSSVGPEVEVTLDARVDNTTCPHGDRILPVGNRH